MQCLHAMAFTLELHDSHSHLDPRGRPLPRSDQAPSRRELCARYNLRTGGRCDCHHGGSRRSGHRRLRGLRRRPGCEANQSQDCGAVCAGVRAHLRAPGLNPPHGRQSFLGHRPDESAFLDPGRVGHVFGRDQAEAFGRSPPDVRRGHRRLQANGRVWRRS